MSLLETLLIGSYLYTTAVFVFLFRLVRNHLSHRITGLANDIKRLEQWTNVPKE